MKTKLFTTIFFLLLLASPMLAMQILSGNDIRISQPVREDLYVFGGTITIDAPVYGDIYSAGGTVTVNDTVYGDLVVAGGNVYLRGVVQDDVRAAAGSLLVAGNISGDLIIAGGTVTVEPSAGIGGDIAISGGTITLSSTVSGSVKAAGGVVTINSAIGKNLSFNGGELTLNGAVNGASEIAATKFHLGENAALRGNVRYWTDAGEINFGNALQNGAIATFDPSLRTQYERPDMRYLGFASFLAVLWYLLAMFILVWLGQWLFTQTIKNAALTAQAEPVRSLGYGFLYFAAVPVAVVLLFVTLIGIPVGLIALFLYLLLLALANIITALIGAHWINHAKNYHWRSIQLVLVAFGLFILLKIVGFIPVIGWIVKIAAVFVAFGAVVENSRIFRRKGAVTPSISPEQS